MLAKLIAIDRPESDVEEKQSADEHGMQPVEHVRFQYGALPDQQEISSSTHWLLNAFNQSRPSTLLEITEQESQCWGKPLPEVIARLEKSYVALTELPFENGDIIVQFFYRPEDDRSRFLFRTIRPAHSRKDCSLPLVTLTVSRSGPFLDFFQEYDQLWASLKFHDYECTFMRLLYLELSL